MDIGGDEKQTAVKGLENGDDKEVKATEQVVEVILAIFFGGRCKGDGVRGT